MIRAPRREQKCDPAVTTARMALGYELTDSWPPGERWRFWSGPDVPGYLAEIRRPDPRKVLGDEQSRLEFACDEATWNESRLTWLKARAKHG